MPVHKSLCPKFRATKLQQKLHEVLRKEPLKRTLTEYMEGLKGASK